MDREEWEGHHRTLAVELGASPEKLKEAYRRLVKEHHPDAVHGQEVAKRRGATAFRAVQEAYEALRDCPAPPPAPEASSVSNEAAPVEIREESGLGRRFAAALVLAAVGFVGVRAYLARPTPDEVRLKSLPPRLEAPKRPPLAPPSAPAKLRPPKDAFERLELPGDYDYHTARGAIPMRILPGTGEARAALTAQRRAGAPGAPELYFSSDSGAFVGVLRMVFTGESSGTFGPSYVTVALELENGSLQDILVGPSPEGDAVDVVLTSADGQMVYTHRLKAFEYLPGVDYPRR